jgi:hypothetical protein
VPAARLAKRPAVANVLAARQGVKKRPGEHVAGAVAVHGFDAVRVDGLRLLTVEEQGAVAAAGDGEASGRRGAVPATASSREAAPVQPSASASLLNSRSTPSPTHRFQAVAEMRDDARDLKSSGRPVRRLCLGDLTRAYRRRHVRCRR